jgi:DNA recombination protein RmuC
MEWAAILVGLLVGSAIGWLLATARTRSNLQNTLRDLDVRARSAETVASEIRGQVAELKKGNDALHDKLREVETARAAVEARALEMQRGFDEQKALLEEAKRKLEGTFGALAAEALRSNNREFLTLADQKLAAVVDPARDALNKLSDELGKIESERHRTHGQLSQQLMSLSWQTDRLVDALKTPSVRGRWGEVQLRRVVEVAGMVEHCDFDEQAGVATEAGRLRPDMRIRLPGGKNVVVDAKAPLQAYMEALEASTEEQRAFKLREHARQIRTHIDQLSSKSYWDVCQPTPEFVVLFLPGEMFFSAALQQDAALIEDGANRKVILATPTTLIALLKAVAYGWRQEQLAENADRISELGRQLHERITTMVDHLGNLGRSLRASVKAFNDAVGSFEGRVLPTVRRFRDLGVAGKKEIEELEPVDSVPRELAPPVESGDIGTALSAAPK